MSGQNARAVKYVKVYLGKDAKGEIRAINEQIDKDMGMAGPYSLSTVSEIVHSARWATTRESYIVSSFVKRKDKEIIAHAVSKSNNCPYCVDSHTGFINAFGDHQLSQAINDETWMHLEDNKVKALIEWGLSTRNPEANMVQVPPFSGKEAPEIIGTALEFHTLNRLVDVFLEKSPMPKITQNKWMKGMALKLATNMLFKEMVHKQPIPGESLQFISNTEVPPHLEWADPVAAYAKALAFQETVLKKIEEEVIPKASAELLKEQLKVWQGEQMPLGRYWLKEAIQEIKEAEKPVSSLILLTAFASFTITEEDIKAFRKVMPNDDQLLKVCYWAAALASQRIGFWLIAPFQKLNLKKHLKAAKT